MTVVKVVELVGESTESWQRAAANAVEEAARTINGITGVEVENWTADVVDGKIHEYKANIKVAFAVEREQ